MFVRVKLLNQYSEPLIYSLPKGENLPLLTIGTIVQVPLRTKRLPAMVVQLLPTKPDNIRFAIKTIDHVEPFPADGTYHTFIAHIAHYYQISRLVCIRRIRLFLEETQQRKKKPKAASSQHEQQITLTPQQHEVSFFIQQAIDANRYAPTLLHGVTGSGKTEVYKSIIVHTIQQQKSALLLLPEVTLALQFEQLLRHQLPEEIALFRFHSATSTTDKRTLWQRLLDGKPTLIIGVHMPILLPIAKLGVIIVDEEHDAGYQEKKHPKFNSKEIAIWRAQLANIPILLGSATPSISSLYNVRTKGWHFFQLTQRFGGTLPTIETVFLTDKKQRSSFWISRPLELAIKDRIAHKEQIIIFINRRGFSFFVQCSACSFTFTCSSCSVSLTLHEHTTLLCHYCGMHMQQPKACPACKRGQDHFIKKGIGTQQVVTILQQLFPNARIGRADMDITAQKKVWKQTITDFTSGALDILVGTQTITKGFHFPRVTLVGVLWADLNLNFPMYNASETALQQLIQVAGRAGRAGGRSHVIVQAMAEHQIFNYLNEIDYISFYESEMASREAVIYPPCIRFAEIELKHTHEITIDKDAGMLAQELLALTERNNYQITILGPAKPPVHKIKGSFSRKIYLKSGSIAEILKVVAAVDKNSYASKIYFTPNPLR